MRFQNLPATLVVLPVLAPLALSQNLAQRYEQEGDTLYRIETTGRFQVDPELVTARFLSPITDLAGFQASLPANAPQVLFGLESVRSNRLGIHDLRVPEGTNVLEVVRAMRQTGFVDFAEENTFGRYDIDPNDNDYGVQWGLKNTGQSGGTVDGDIDADQAWDIVTGDSSVIVAVLDSGTSISHPDLSSTTWHNLAETPGNGQDDDNNGYIDDVDGWDFANNNNSVPGSFWHGTFVTGIVNAQTNNNIGIAGVAGGFNGGDACLAMACGVGDSFPVGSVLDDAIIYAADNGARVITMSLSVGSSSAINNALDYARNTRGLFIDCAAGNGGGSVSYPATNVNVAAVAATNRFDNRASFSNQGPQLSVAAPGQDIRSTQNSNGYGYSDGTSFSAPHVAGTVGLMLSVDPTLSISPEAIEHVLQTTADDIGAAGFDNQTGWGRINAHAAVMAILNGDCNNNGVFDYDDIDSGSSQDANGNGTPDECECTGGAVNYCVGANNSTGAGGAVSWGGSTSVANNDLVLQATQLPVGEFGLFIYGQNQTQTPLFDGFLCVATPFIRFPVQVSDNLGFLTQPVDITSPPQQSGQITVGSTWNFQCFYRDTNSTNTQGNLTDGLSVMFCN
ncbi:MAG: S8 family serine peptidase [bacterium]|nr:S8 family serine peptidase [bacterium]